jgi:hypothetical protein
MAVLKGVISYPIPAYQNLPIESQFYQPSQFVISGITLGVQTTVTTSVAHNFVVGNQIRLLIPVGYGSTQLNESFGYVLSVPTTTSVLTSINSVNSDAFISASLAQSPQIMAIGDVNTGQINSNGVNSNLNIPGSFINISPL